MVFTTMACYIVFYFMYSDASISWDLLTLERLPIPRSAIS